MVLVLLEFTGVMLRFFNRDAMHEIAGVVCHLVCLHPSIENLTNFKVTNVYTIIDPEKKILEFVNARFKSGDTRITTVSNP